MKHLKNMKISGLMLILFGIINIPVTGFSQVKYQSQLTNILISGTSTLHDWEMKSSNGQLDATLVLNNDKLTSISALSFTMQSESLKSGHGMMDNNTYKALKTNTYSNINFVLSSVTVTPQDANTYLLRCLGKLTIAGTTHETDLLVTCKWNATDKSFSCTGTKKIKMTDYNVKPPVIMMGAIKTGDDIEITYNLKINKI